MNENTVNAVICFNENRRTTKQDRSFFKLRSITDEACKKHHLSVIAHPEMSKGKCYWEWDMSRQGLSWKTKLKFAIDQVVKQSEDFSVFLLKCAENGILVEYNPDHKIDLKFMLAEQKENNPVQNSRGQKRWAAKMDSHSEVALSTYINSETSAGYYSYGGS